MTSRADVLITVAELARRLQAGLPVSILDVRWTLAQPDGRDGYLRGHLPGAVYCSLEDELTDHGVGGRGRHPLPSGAAVQAAARRWGLRRGVPVVVYDDWNRAGSARAWWVLTAAGIADVRILDGGLRAWTTAGHRVDTGAVRPPPGDVTVIHDDLYAGALPAVTAAQAAERPLIDARTPDRFRGETEPVDPVAGHIPGAVNLPGAAVLTEDGGFAGADALAHRLAAHRVAPADGTAVYCGSGVTAAVVVAALAAAGVTVAMFPGSWSEWVADASRPVATGEGERPVATGEGERPVATGAG